MPGRTYDAGSGYRYGFNGKENDNEIKGEGNQQDYGFRIYDPRIGRFLSTDPLTKTYPWYTPYQFAGNMPIVAVDLDGKEPHLITNYSIRNAGKNTLKVLKGAGNVILQAFGAITQIGGAMEYGEKVPKDKFAEQFPLIANDNIAKDLILPMFTTPVDLAKKLRDNPADAELWGEALGIMALVKGGSYAGKITSGEFGLKVDLMGGTKSKYKGYVNYDVNAASGIKDGVNNFKNHFGEGTIRDMVVDNPQASFLSEVAGSIAKDGTITISGQMSNKFFKTIWDGTEEGLKGFEIMPNSKKTGLSNEGYKKSDGTTLGGSNNLNEITLRKK